MIIVLCIHSKTLCLCVESIVLEHDHGDGKHGKNGEVHGRVASRERG